MKLRTGFYLFMLTLLFSCKRMDKYEWRPTESSPLLYPMNIVSGYLIMEDGNSIYIPCSGVSHTGWGDGGSTHVVGPDEKAIPVRLEVTWASFLEDKFYTGAWDLPVDKVKALFKTGLINWDNKQKTSYQEVVVGLAPGGVAVVWLYGYHQQIEIGRFQAKKTHVSMRDYVPGNPTISQKEYFDVSKSVPEAYANKKVHGIQYGLWDSYRKKFQWRPEIEIPGREFKMLMMQMFNGERETLFDSTMTNNSFKARAIPKAMTYTFIAKGSKATSIEFKSIDEEEIFSIFRKLDPHQSIEIVLKMDKDLSNRSLFIRQGKQVYPLKNIDMENIWEDD